MFCEKPNCLTIYLVCNHVFVFFIIRFPLNVNRKMVIDKPVFEFSSIVLTICESSFVTLICRFVCQCTLIRTNGERNVGVIGVIDLLPVLIYMSYLLLK